MHRDVQIHCNPGLTISNPVIQGAGGRSVIWHCSRILNLVKIAICLRANIGYNNRTCWKFSKQIVNLKQCLIAPMAIKVVSVCFVL